MRKKEKRNREGEEGQACELSGRECKVKREREKEFEISGRECRDVF